MQLMYSVSLCPEILDELTTRTETAFQKKVIKMLHGRFVHVGKTLTDLQIWGCRPLDCTKMRLVAGLRPDALGEL